MDKQQQAPPAKPVIPSAEYRWALASMKMKKVWIGLTERELSLFYRWQIEDSPQEWLVWQVGWTDWKLFTDAQLEINKNLPKFPEEFPSPPRQPRSL